MGSRTMRILFLTGRFPYPLLRGDQSRAYHQIRLLSRQHAVTLVTFADSHTDREGCERLRKICARLVPVSRSRLRAAWNLCKAPLCDYPFQTLWYWLPQMQ